MRNSRAPAGASAILLFCQLTALPAFAQSSPPQANPPYVLSVFATAPAELPAAFCTVNHGKMLATVDTSASMIAPLGATAINGLLPAVGDTFAYVAPANCPWEVNFTAIALPVFPDNTG